MKTASVAIFITFFLGLFIAKIVCDIKQRYLKMILDCMLTIPLVLPPTVLGFFLLHIFGVRRPIGQFLIDYFSFRIVFSWTATVIASVVISFPLMYRASRGALEQLDSNIIYAGRTLGLSEWKIFWKVRFPTALSGIISGAILAFARGLGEFGATIMIAGNISGKTQTLPLAIYSEVNAGNMDSAYNYVLIIVTFSFIVVFLMNYFTLKDRKINKEK